VATVIGSSGTARAETLTNAILSLTTLKTRKMGHGWRPYYLT
jgi:hypothetical protein